MDPIKEETRLGAGGWAIAGLDRSATALDVVVGRAVAISVIGGLLVCFLALAFLHRGAVVRQLVAEVGTAVQTAASTLSDEGEPAQRAHDAAPLLQALLRLHAVDRVTWLMAGTEPSLCLTRAGAAAAPWRRPDEVPLGQWLGPERFRLARAITHSGRSDSVIVVEGSLEPAVQREAENVAHAARVFALVVLLTLCIAPWLGRRVAERWTRALRVHHERICHAAPASCDPELILEAVERRVMAERTAHDRPPSDPPLAPARRTPQRAATAVRALVVDDNEKNLQLVQYLLTLRGYAVDVASDGESALEAFSRGEYDVILMDCQMPGIDGLEATRRMRVLERSSARHTPILAMSASAFGSDVQACRDAGMDDHIAKPFLPKELLARLEVWIASAHPEARSAAIEPHRHVMDHTTGPVLEAVGQARMPPLEGAVDGQVLGPLLEDESGRTLAAELVNLFSTIGPETMSSLEQRLASGELDEVARIAHRFVSTSGSVGAVRLARVMREVESACNRQRPDEASALLAHATGELDVASTELKRRFARASDLDGHVSRDEPTHDRGAVPDTR